MKAKTVQSGVMHVAVVGTVIMILCLVLYYIFQQQQLKSVESIAKNDRELLIDRVMLVTSLQYTNIIHDNSAWDECYQAMQDGDKEWLDANIGYMVEGYEAADVALFSTQGKRVYEKKADGYTKTKFFPFEGEKLPNLFYENSFPTFYMQHGHDIYVYYGAGLVSAADINARSETPRGYMFFVKQISEDDIRDYKRALGRMDVGLVLSRMEVEMAEENLAPKHVVSRELTDYRGIPAAYMYFAYSDAMSKQFERFIPIFIIVSLLCLGILLSILLYVDRKITKPLARIDASFKSGKADDILPLKKEVNEFGVISQMMEEFFVQKDNLNKMNIELQTRQEEILVQNETLQQQKEEILVQNETLQQQKEEILVQNENMQMMNEQLQFINENLEKQKEKISTQATDLEEKNNELTTINTQITQAHEQLTAGVTYASRLQTAMLDAVAPNNEIFKSVFTIYHPKNIVGGDFYFAKKVGTKVIAALGDCTGHGVPGAILASMGISFLNQLIISAGNDLMPDLILNRLREEITRALGLDQEGGLRSDGMDIALLIYDTTYRSGYFAGAQRPLILVRDNEIYTIKGDPMPIGRFVKNEQFSCIPIRLQKNDKVYLFSDGCTDQVGGDKKRKLMAKNFKAKLLEYSSLEMSKQKEELENFLEQWRGENPRTDDVSLLAFEI